MLQSSLVSFFDRIKNKNTNNNILGVVLNENDVLLLLIKHFFLIVDNSVNHSNKCDINHIQTNPFF